MIDERERYERAFELFDMPGPSWDRLIRRRERKRRKQRIAAGVVGIAVFVAAIWIVTSGGLLDRSRGGQQPATSGPTSPGGVPPIATAPWVSRAATPQADYVLDLDTGSMTPLPEAIIRSIGESRPRSDYRYAPSPDGSSIAYTALAGDGRYQIFVAGIDGSGIMQVTTDPMGAVSPAWSPDGTKIAFAGDLNEGGNGLFVVEVATGNTTQLIDRNQLISTPQFTPDGSSILYTGGTNTRPLLMTVPVAGGNSTLLFEPGGGIGDSGDGAISPDGALVTYLGSGNPDSGEVGHCGPCRFVANVDGSGRHVISGWMANPAGTWSPDGTRIVTLDDLGPADPSFINVVDVATGAGLKVAYGRAAVWLDDHTLLVEVRAR
jgi:dipeptidyl aminopeptidase/acylaminoacyl peptidase